MSADQHDLDVANDIGSIKTTLKFHGDAHTLILNKLTEIDTKLTIQNGSIGKAHTRIDELAPAMAAANDYLDNKKKVKWVLAGMSVAGLGGGFTLTAWLDKLRVLIGGG